MTLAFGAVCSDGVVIVEDKRITEMSGFIGPDIGKLFGVIRHIIFGYAGAQFALEVFLRYVIGDLIIERDGADAYTAENNLERFCLAIKKLNTLRMKEMDLTIIVARQFPGLGRDSDLHVIDRQGTLNKISERYDAIGSGRDIGLQIVSKELRSDQKRTMKEFAKLAYYAIKRIDVEKLEPSVGGEPTIVYLGHRTLDDQAAPAGDIAEFQSFFDDRMKAM